MDIGTRAWNKSARDFGPKIFPVNYEGLGIKLQLDPSNGDGVKLEISKISEPYVDLSAAFPNLAYYTAEQTELINAHRADIRTLVGRSGAQWISQGGVESGWDASASATLDGKEYGEHRFDRITFICIHVRKVLEMWLLSNKILLSTK